MITASRKTMVRVLLLTALLFALIVCLSAIIRSGGRPDLTLTEIEMHFGLAWPSNHSNLQMSSWGYYSPLDGSSRTKALLARFEMKDTEFTTWYAQMNELGNWNQHWMPIKQREFIKRAPWWDVHKENVVWEFRAEPPSGTSGELWIFVKHADHKKVVYIQSRIVSR